MYVYLLHIQLMVILSVRYRHSFNSRIFTSWCYRGLLGLQLPGGEGVGVWGCDTGTHTHTHTHTHTPQNVYTVAGDGLT